MLPEIDHGSQSANSVLVRQHTYYVSESAELPVFDTCPQMLFTITNQGIQLR